MLQTPQVNQLVHFFDIKTKIFIFTTNQIDEM